MNADLKGTKTEIANSDGIKVLGSVMFHYLHSRLGKRSYVSRMYHSQLDRYLVLPFQIRVHPR